MGRDIDKEMLGFGTLCSKWHGLSKKHGLASTFSAQRWLQYTQIGEKGRTTKGIGVRRSISKLSWKTSVLLPQQERHQKTQMIECSPSGCRDGCRAFTVTSKANGFAWCLTIPRVAWKHSCWRCWIQVQIRQSRKPRQLFLSQSTSTISCVWRRLTILLRERKVRDDFSAADGA